MERIGSAAEKMNRQRRPGVDHVYPTSETWQRYRPDTELLDPVHEMLNTTSRGTLAIAGPSQSGKTFHLLRLGLWWEARGRDHLAFYAPRASLLDREDVFRLWAATRASRCLWLVDEIDADAAEVLRHLVEEFEEVSNANHWLITAGWSTGRIEKIPDASVEVLEWPLTEFLVAESLLASEHGTLATPERIGHLTRSRLGLRDILHAARYQPDLLDQPSRYEFWWVERVLERVPERAKPLLPLLAGLRFLAQPFHPAHPDEVERITEIEATADGVLRNEEGVRQGYLLDEDFAQRMMRLRLMGRANPADEFVSGLRTHTANIPLWPLLTTARLLESLRSRTERDLLAWLRLPGPAAGTDDPPLIASIVDDDLLHRVRTAIVQEVDAAGTSAIATCLRLFEALDFREEWVGRTATEVWDRFGGDALRAWASSDLASWEVAATLAGLTGTSRPEIDHAAASESIGRQLEQASGSTQGQLLKAADESGQRGAYAAFLAIYTDRLRREHADLPAKGAWRRLLTLGRREPAAAVSVLMKQKLARVRDLIYQSPAMARKFKTAINSGGDDEVRARLQNAFATVLERFVVGADDVAHWTSPHELIAIINIAWDARHVRSIDTEPVGDRAAQLVRTASAAVLKELGHLVAVRAKGSRLHAATLEAFVATARDGLPPINQRLEAISLLDKRRITKEMIARTSEDWRQMKPLDAFWLLWRTVNSSHSGGMRLAESIFDARSSLVEFPRTALALQGLCLFVLKDYLGDAWGAWSIEIPPPDEATPAPASPPMTVCQLLSLCHAADSVHDVAYGNVLWMAKRLAIPSAEYRRQWGRLGPSDRRMALKIQFDAVTILLDKQFLDAARSLAAGAADGENDGIWNAHLLLRLEITRLCGGDDRAWALLVKQCDAWARIIKQMGRSADTRLYDLLRDLTDPALNPPPDAVECAARLLRLQP